MIRKNLFPTRIPWSWLRRGSIGILLLAVLLLGLNHHVDGATSKLRFSSTGQVPSRSVAIVFGAAVYQHGQLSPMLAARVRQAAEVYRLGRVRKILMTGDNGRTDYDEVTAMKRYAIALGVPAEAIHLDYAGFSTYESCYRAHEIFGIQDAIVITQGFHLARAVYTCAHLGIETVGLETNDRGIYPMAIMKKYVIREVFATGKALWDIHLRRPLPTFLGNYEGME